jgi:hypothetical protein
MNNDMIPFVVYLLQSDDLKKQSDRIIQEVRNNNDAKHITDELTASLSNAAVIQSIIQTQKNQLDLINGIKQSIDDLNNKIDGNFTLGSSDTPIPAGIDYGESHKKRALKK